MKRGAGFTLIEVLVALGIFALVALLGYRGLSSMIGAEAQLSTEAARWQRLERFLSEFETDIRYAAPRGGRDAGGVLQPALRGVPGVKNQDDAHLSVTRYHQGSGLTTGTPQRVGYSFAPPEVALLIWPALDLAQRSRPERITVLDGVREASARYMDKAGVWHGAWPAGNVSDEMPLAVELTLDMDGAGRITRLIAR